MFLRDYHFYSRTEGHILYGLCWKEAMGPLTIWLSKSPKNSNNRIPRVPESNKRQLRRGNNHYLATSPNMSFKIYQQTFEIQKIRHLHSTFARTC